MENKNDDLLQCEICGKYFEHLGSHIYGKHKITANEYKMEFGLNLKRGLVSKEIHNKLHNSAIENKMGDRLKLFGNEYKFKKGNHNKHYISKEEEERRNKMRKEIDHSSEIVKCNICNKEFKNINNHLKIHKNLEKLGFKTVEEYKKFKASEYHKRYNEKYPNLLTERHKKYVEKPENKERIKKYNKERYLKIKLKKDGKI